METQKASAGNLQGFEPEQTCFLLTNGGWQPRKLAANNMTLLAIKAAAMLLGSTRRKASRDDYVRLTIVEFQAQGSPALLGAPHHFGE